MRYNLGTVPPQRGHNNKMLVRIDTKVAWQIARDPKSERWVGVCQMLGITAEAETWAKLTALIAEEVSELLVYLFQEGELQSFCKIAVGARWLHCRQRCRVRDLNLMFRWASL